MGTHHPSFFEALELRLLLAAGDPDPTFGVGGRADHPRGDQTSFSDSVVLANDKVLFAGTIGTVFVSEREQYVLRRFNADGSLDTTFGTSGTTSGFFSDNPSGDSEISQILVQPDGKIIARGEESFQDLIVRFDANGSLDTTFGGGDGMVEILSDRIALQPDGKILVGRGTLTRLNADGSIDTTFGNNGTTDDPLLREVGVIRVQADGKILLGGETFVPGTGDFGTVARANPDGSLDTTFGDGGRVMTELENGIGDMALLPGGKFLAGGSRDGQFSILRFNADGSIDTTFANGLATVPFGDFLFDGSMLVDADQNVILIGDVFNGMAVTRLDPTGQVDESFGRVITDAGNARVFARGGGIQSNGKLLVLGIENEFLGDSEVDRKSFIIRYLTEDDGVPTPITLDPASHVLSIPGTGGNDVSGVVEDNGVLRAHRNGFGRAFDAADVQLIAISGRDGDDIIVAQTNTVSAHISGGAGVDRISGSDRADTLEGGAGPDFIDGNNGADLITGGAGNDQIRGLDANDTMDGGDGDDELRGGAGDDTYVPSAGNDINIDLDLRDVTFVDGLLKFFDRRNSNDQVSLWDDGAGGLVIYLDGETNTIPLNLVQRIELNGNGGDDLLKLNPGLFIPATIYGGEGGDTSTGGNDTVIGGAAGDVLQGNSEDDFVFGNGGDDIIGEGGFGPGTDVLRGGAGRDTVDYTGHGNLTITLDGVQDDGEAGENDLVFSDIERIIGGAGDDRITGAAGLSLLYGGEGNDTLSGGAGFDALYGGGGNDRLDGGTGDDYLEGGQGHDLLSGGAGADLLFALAGNDVLLSDGDGVKDTVRGGAGTDAGDVDNLDDVLDVEAVS